MSLIFADVLVGRLTDVAIGFTMDDGSDWARNASGVTCSLFGFADSEIPIVCLMGDRIHKWNDVTTI